MPSLLDSPTGMLHITMLIKTNHTHVVMSYNYPELDNNPPVTAKTVGSRPESKQPSGSKSIEARKRRLNMTDVYKIIVVINIQRE